MTLLLFWEDCGMCTSHLVGFHKTTQTKAKAQSEALRHTSQYEVLPFCRSSFSTSCLFFFLSLSAVAVFAETGSVAIRQVQTVKGAAKKAWRGTGKITSSLTHSLTHPPCLICLHYFTFIVSLLWEDICLSELEY